MTEQQSYLSRPWTKHAEKLGLPASLAPYPMVPLFKFLDDAVRDFPERPAITYLGRQITYSRLGKEVDSLAAALTDLGVTKNDRVGTILVNSPQFVIADYAILKCGASNVPCSPLHGADDLEHEIGSAGVETIICMDTSLEKVQSIKDKTQLKNIIITGVDDYSAGGRAQTNKVNGTHQFRDLIMDYEPNPPQVTIDPLEDLAEVPFTGGSTGLPKGVMLTHMNMIANTLQMWGPVEHTELGPLLIKGNAAILLGLPLFHQYGHWAMHGAVYLAWNMLMVPDPRDIDMIISLMNEYRPIMNVGVPTQYMRLAQEKTGRVGVIGASGSAALPAEVAEKYEEATGAPLDEGYGLTETSPVTHTNITGLLRLLPQREEPIQIPPLVKSIGNKLGRTAIKTIGGERIIKSVTYVFPHLVNLANRREKKQGTTTRKKGSIGHPVFDTDCKLVDDKGNEVPFGEKGEMWIKGPQVMKGYWPDKGAGLVDGWLPTGDVARMDEDGYFFIVDRIKDMINVSGNKVYSLVIDDLLYQHPGVEMAGVVGIPDPDRQGSERVKAFIKLAPGRDSEKVSEELIALCKEKLPPYAVPKSVEFRDELPLTVTEKIFKRKLREEEINKMKAEGLLPQNFGQ